MRIMAVKTFLCAFTILVAFFDCKEIAALSTETTPTETSTYYATTSETTTFETTTIGCIGRLTFLFLGPLMGGPQCRLSILRNAMDVTCHYFSNVHVDLKKVSCRMSNLRNTLCHGVYFYPPVTRLYVACQF